jgi:hypothetical protein
MPNTGADLVEVGDLIRSPRSGNLYRVIYIDPEREPPAAVVECGGLGAPLVNAPVRYVYPERFEREH